MRSAKDRALADVLVDPIRRKSLERRLYAKTKRDPGSGCLLWTGGRDRIGYGHIKLGPKNGPDAAVHRVAWALRHGPIPEGQCVLHRCDVRWCIEDGHHFLGTQLENIEDRERKRRTAVGRRNGRAKLYPGVVARIKRELLEGRRIFEIARDAGISQGAIFSIKNGESWKHISPEPALGSPPVAEARQR